MYSSLNNNGTKPQISSSLLISYYNDIYSTTPQEHNHSPSSSSSFLVPSPFNFPLEDEAVFNEFFQQQFFSIDHNQSIPAYEMNNIVESAIEECSNNNGRQIATVDGDDDHCDFEAHVEHEKTCPRKRRPNRDRHSKINTARGPRDRRIRLSLDVAKKFFGLQDLLGFDMASKTLDWLLSRSQTAILDLFPNRSGCSFMGVSNSASSTSECEVVSAGAGEQFMIKTKDDRAITTKRKGKPCSESSKKQKDKITRVRKCADSHHPLAKETRVRARQRARERTTEKMNKYKHGVDQDSTFRPCLDKVMDEDVNQLGSWSSTFQECHHQMSLNFQSNQGLTVGDNSSLLLPALFWTNG